MEMKGHGDILLYSSLLIDEHHEQGSQHCNLSKNPDEKPTKQLSNLYAKDTQLISPHKPHVCVQNTLQEEQQYIELCSPSQHTSQIQQKAESYRWKNIFLPKLLLHLQLEILILLYTTVQKEIW